MTLLAGIVLHGAPGVGKSFLARAIAGETSMNFLTLESHVVTNKVVGESEKALAKLFESARSAAPCVLVVDQLESVAGKRNDREDNPTLTHKRLLSVLVQEIEASRGKVFVVGATNDISRIDTALLRPGRLEIQIFVDFPKATDREEMLKEWIQKVPNDVEEIVIQKLVEKTENFSASQLQKIIQEASFSAMRNGKEKLTEKSFEDILK